MDTLGSTTEMLGAIKKAQLTIEKACKQTRGLLPSFEQGLWITHELLAGWGGVVTLGLPRLVQSLSRLVVASA